MPTLLLAIIIFLLLPFSTAPAVAEDTPEINLAKGILVYQGFEHWLNLSYDYNASKTDQSANNSSAINISHVFRESYNASLRLALFDSRIFDTTMQGSAALDQNLNKSSNGGGEGGGSSTTSRNNTYQYNFTGSGLSRSRIPFTINSFNSTNTSLNTFTAPTTTNTFGNEFGISFLNDKLQSNFHYTRNSSDTSVDGTKSSSLTNAYSYNAEHHYGTFSNTSLSLSFSDQSGGSSSGTRLSSAANTLMLSNTLLFGARRQYSLASTFQLNNTASDNLPTRSITFSESFSATLGKALYFTSTYIFATDRSTNPTGKIKENSRNQGNASLTHKLFDSLRTELHGSVAINNEYDGTENRYSMRGSTTYSKRLAAGSNFSLGINKGYDLIDRKVGSDTTTIRDELHPSAHQGNVIKLVLPGGTLRSVTAVSSRNPIFTYVEGIDYTVNYDLGRITVMTGGGVRIDMDGAGTDLYITYIVYQDPQIKYSTDTLSLNSNLSLFDSQITLGGSFSKNGQKVISGPANNSLQGSRSLMLYVSGYYDNFSTQISYLNDATGNQVYQSYEGELTAQLQTDFASLSLTAHDTYSLYDASLKSAAYRENNASVSLSVSKNFLSNIRLTLNANANDARSEIGSARESVSLRGNCQYSLNMISINLSGQTSWVFTTNGTSRNDTLHADLTRYF